MHKPIKTLVLFIAAASLALGACKSKSAEEKQEPLPGLPGEDIDTEPPTVEPADDNTSPGKEFLTIAETKFTFEMEGQETKSMTFTQDGKLILDGKELAMIKANGELHVDGKKIATLNADGTVTAEDSTRPLKILADGTVEADGKAIKLWTDEGMLSAEAAEELEGLKVKMEGEAAGRHAATFAFVAAMLMMGDEGEEQAPCAPDDPRPACQLE